MMHRKLLHPIEDTYISQFYANTNFGGVPYLYTNRYQGPLDEYQSLIKFDLGKHDHFRHTRHKFRSQLRLKIYRNELPVPITLFVYKVIGQWSELNVTWNNRPATAPEPIGSAIVHPGFFGWVEINLDHFSDHEGLLLKCHENFDSLLGFFAREYVNPDFWPQLKILSVAAADEADKPIVTVTPITASVVLSPDLVKVPPFHDHRRRHRGRKIARADRRCDRAGRRVVRKRRHPMC
jgi:hypothetical protein